MSEARYFRKVCFKRQYQCHALSAEKRHYAPCNKYHAITINFFSGNFRSNLQGCVYERNPQGRRAVGKDENQTIRAVVGRTFFLKKKRKTWQTKSVTVNIA